MHAALSALPHVCLMDWRLLIHDVCQIAAFSQQNSGHCLLPPAMSMSMVSDSRLLLRAAKRHRRTCAGENTGTMTTQGGELVSSLHSHTRRTANGDSVQSSIGKLDGRGHHWGLTHWLDVEPSLSSASASPQHDAKDHDEKGALAFPKSLAQDLRGIGAGCTPLPVPFVDSRGQIAAEYIEGGEDAIEHPTLLSGTQESPDLVHDSPGHDQSPAESSIGGALPQQRLEHCRGICQNLDDAFNANSGTHHVFSSATKKAVSSVTDHIVSIICEPQLVLAD